MIKNILKHSNWIAINKNIVKIVGCNAAYLLGYLADKEAYFAGLNTLIDGYFYATESDVEADIHLSRREQETAIQRLVAISILETKLKGIPARRHFRFTEIAESIIYDALTIQTSMHNADKQVCTKRTNCNAQNVQTIYKEDILRTNIKNSSNTSNDVLEQTRAKFSENEFANFCNTHQLPNLSKSVLFQNFFLEKEKSCANKEKYGEAAYIATLQSIEAYIVEKPKYLSNKKDFGRVFDNFAISPEVVSLENAFKAAYFERYEVQHANIRKSEESAAKAILAALRGQLKLNEKQEVPPAQIKAFFTATLGLATYNNPMQAKLAFIASSFSQIIAALKAAKEGKSTSAGGNIETFRERDKRLQEEEANNRDAKMRAAALYAAQKEQLERFTDNGWAITEEMKLYPAYEDMFGGAPFGSEEAF